MSEGEAEGEGDSAPSPPRRTVLTSTLASMFADVEEVEAPIRIPIKDTATPAIQHRERAPAVSQVCPSRMPGRGARLWV